MSKINDWSFFWDNRDKFKLGHLTTEKANVKTIGLAEKSREDIISAINMIRNVDIDALQVLKKFENQFEDLKRSIAESLQSGSVFISGCGATGRLALLLESLWKQHAPDNLKNKVIGFMAGGDAALVKSVEGFEDHSEYAERHVRELGFSNNDLMIGVTEGGETPFVLSTVNYAQTHSQLKPWLIYCNPDASLQSVKRSNDLIASQQVTSVSLTIDSMALAGSTRMQATTVQTLFVGLALFAQFSPVDYQYELDQLIKAISSVDINAAMLFTAFESKYYTDGGYITYVTDESLGLTILTDTTERAPTFSVVPFENINDKADQPSLCYLSIINGGEDTWESILKHPPRTLEWSFSLANTGVEKLYGFDISPSALQRRAKLNKHSVVEVKKLKNGFNIGYDEQVFEINHSPMSEVTSQVLLKTILNAHSTITMGRLGRYTSNIMTYVSPANNKLIDRSIRYVQYLLEQSGHLVPSYDQIAIALYEASKDINKTDSIVMVTYNQIIDGGSRAC